MTESTAPHIVSAATAAADGAALLIDCRHRFDDSEWGRRAFREGHLPGAVHAHLNEDLSGPVGPSTGRHPLPDREAFAQWLGECGLTPQRPVYVYDDQGGLCAARAWWMLRIWFGHPTAALIDGGIDAWQSEGYPLSDGAAKATDASTPYPLGEVPTATVSADDVLHGSTTDLLVVDARTADRYRGEPHPLDPVSGHIPGALNYYFGDNLTEQQRFRSLTELEAQWKPLLDQAGSRRLVMSCGSGVTACHNLLALAHIGHVEAYLFPPSWSGWIDDASRPIARASND